MTYHGMLTYHITLQGGHDLYDMPDGFLVHPRVDCPYVSTYSCRTSFFSWVTLHEGECPHKMQNLRLIWKGAKTNWKQHSIPQPRPPHHKKSKIKKYDLTIYYNFAKSVLNAISDSVKLVGDGWLSFITIEEEAPSEQVHLPDQFWMPSLIS